MHQHKTQYQSHVKPELQEKNEQENTRQTLLGFKLQFERQRLLGTNRRERIEKLLQRRSAKKWSLEKQAKMARRHSATQDQCQQADSMLDQVNLQLEKLASGSETNTPV